MDDTDFVLLLFPTTFYVFMTSGMTSVFMKLSLLWLCQYILESNLDPFYSFRGLKNQIRIRFTVESWILEIWCTTDNSATFVRNLLGALCISLSMLQRKPHSAHKPYGPSFPGFKTTLRNVQRSGPLYRLVAKSLLKKCEDCIINFRKLSFLESSEFFRDTLHPLIAALYFRHSRTLLSSTPKISAALWFPFCAH
jgi:hypothetical protein